MKFDHIIIAFSTNKRPPSFKDINDKNGDFVFSPLAKDEVYSADTALWGIRRGRNFCAIRTTRTKMPERVARE